MTKKWKILGYQTTIEWYDVKTKFKQLLRKIVYSWLVQEILSLLITSYMWLVYLTSRKVFVNREVMFEAAKNKGPMIIATWHNRLMMLPFTAIAPRKKYPGYNVITLASKHGDGRLVGRVMEKMGLISILGSSQGGRKSSRGIDIGSMRRIFSGLKQGLTIAITPDGPRGPNQKINGEIINIARLSGARIVAASYSSSNYKRLNTWDKFTIPLPFSTLCFYFDEQLLEVARNSDEKAIKELKELLEEKINIAQEKSLGICYSGSL